MKNNNFTTLLRITSAALLGLALTMGQAFAKEKVTVFAAASLTNALSEIGQQFDKTHDTDVVFSLLHLPPLPDKLPKALQRIFSSLLTRNGWTTWLMNMR